MKQLYWDSVEEEQKFFFTMTKRGVNFVSSPGRFLSEIYDFYPGQEYDLEYKYEEEQTKPVKEQLEEYLTGKREEFDVPLDLTDTGTEFQQQVWRAIQTIPYGQTITYKQLAEQIGKSSAIRAVGNAVAMNPLLILVPCHRVVKANGDLGKYRGGVAAKQKLLELEQTVITKKAAPRRLPLPLLNQLNRPGL
ncbi:methylated-DNA--[protein]-cysteine S-methyltransferase [Lentilactobacillus senioris]|uniref:methylated-DNA--[protein]-cysteine S-methyltransferase n=1 Tax=Lentilactobacillus senioris TaxID=931534 RepID=UPI00228237B1|nr:methylated-DNA--[protein]-cysteine S-methyltransferase [Lentilactobacillus senioris]MCY9806292.1 methylated-DNA--[protein]-cysteine S-methyltransferase [Lentilactobacillus senioris]